MEPTPQSTPQVEMSSRDQLLAQAKEIIRTSAHDAAQRSEFVKLVLQGTKLRAAA